MSKYTTRQRKLLISYLSMRPDQQLQAKQIACDLESEDISLSAVYRNLAQLELEGKVKRCSKKGSREVFYQYFASQSCKDSLHLTCKNCGETTHMESVTANNLVLQVANDESFFIDKADTVIFGLCNKCNKN